MKRLSFATLAMGLVFWACGPQMGKPFGEDGTGGATASGGTPGGGTGGTGGISSSTGGAAATGGSRGGTGGSASGGATGGATPATGGNASGGVGTTGGAGSGGTGGKGTGGGATGGNASGGSASGGSSTGGAATGGGTATGGTATGGAATGGAATGGAATGGAATGGAGGTGPTCASLSSDYQTAVNNAKSCTTTGTCGFQISRTICGCSGCPSTTFVSDTSGPDRVVAQWHDLGCQCPKTLCVICTNEPSSATCSSILLPRSCQDQTGGVATTN